MTGGFMKKSVRVTALLFISGTLLAADLDYEPCEKTYVDPIEILLEENKIKVVDGECLSQTSALYSDENGLYYKDLMLEKLEEVDLTPLIAEDEAVIETDALIDPFEEMEEILVLNFPEEEVAAEEEEVQEMILAPPLPSKPNTLPWPFCDKMR